jgi:hypothetical protein
MNDQVVQQADTARPPLDSMFPQLVKEADTPEQKLIGFIAYGLYEEARREWASDFRDREGRYPGENERVAGDADDRRDVIGPFGVGQGGAGSKHLDHADFIA